MTPNKHMLVMLTLDNGAVIAMDRVGRLLVGVHDIAHSNSGDRSVSVLVFHTPENIHLMMACGWYVEDGVWRMTDGFGVEARLRGSS